MNRRQSLSIVGAGLGIILAAGLFTSAMSPTAIPGTPRSTTATWSFVYPTTTAPPTAVPVVPTTMPPHRLPAPPAAYYKNCAEAKEAGAAPILRDHPSYRKELDRDGDGIACDK